MLDISPATLLLDDYGLTRGFFVENFAACELRNQGIPLYTWRRRNAEIEFLVDFEGSVVPVEVKSGRRTKAKSLAQYIAKYNPKRAYTFSAKRFSDGDNIKQNIPLYFAGRLRSLHHGWLS
jgi:predicted AAA+ superfamily ATPase